VICTGSKLHVSLTLKLSHSRPIGDTGPPSLSPRFSFEDFEKLLRHDIGGILNRECTPFGDYIGRSIWSKRPGEARLLISAEVEWRAYFLKCFDRFDFLLKECLFGSHDVC
jgi:hypothetical protein